MTTINPTEDFIFSNYQKLIGIVPSDVKAFLEKDGFAARYSFCPASSRKEYFSSFPGGLVYHSLNLVKWVSRFSALMGAENEFDKNSLLRVSLLHCVGKVGTLEEEYYLPQRSQWHRDRGMLYEINPNLQYMKIPQRSLFLAQEAGIKLTNDEYLAILLSDGQYDDSNSSYKYKEPKLALVLQNAIQWARKLEKENSVVDL